MKHLTTGDISRMCLVAPRTVARWFDTGQLVGWKVPGSKFRRFTERTVYDFLVKNKMPIPVELQKFVND